MASLIGSGMALDTLSPSFCRDVPYEVSGGLEGVSVREHRGLFCSGCVGKKVLLIVKKGERVIEYPVYSRGVDAFLQECVHRLLKKVGPESCHELVSSEIECGK